MIWVKDSSPGKSLVIIQLKSVLWPREPGGSWEGAGMAREPGGEGCVGAVKGGGICSNKGLSIGRFRVQTPAGS